MDGGGESIKLPLSDTRIHWRFAYAVSIEKIYIECLTQIMISGCRVVLCSMASPADSRSGSTPAGRGHNVKHGPPSSSWSYERCHSMCPRENSTIAPPPPNPYRSNIQSKRPLHDLCSSGAASGGQGVVIIWLLGGDTVT